MSERPRVHEKLTFKTPVMWPALQPEYEQRMRMLLYFENVVPYSVEFAQKLYNDIQDLKWSNVMTESRVRGLATYRGGEEYMVYRMEADETDGYKPKFLEYTKEGLLVQTEDRTNALKEDGVFFFKEGVVLRIFSGFVPSLNRYARQATVDLLNIEPPKFFSQSWVDENIRGLSSYAFKVDGYRVIPAGKYAQHGVNPDSENLDELLAAGHIEIKDSYYF